MMAARRPSAIPMILVAGVSIAYWEYVQYVFMGLVFLLLAKFTIRLVRLLHSIILHFSFRDIDNMNGLEFECYVADLLYRQGYSNVSLTEQFDYGVDIVAEKDGIRWGIQTKRYSGLVKAAAVRQVVTGLRLYGCDRGMVITNSTFSRVAKQLAEGNDCVLIDRYDLRGIIN